MHQRVRGDPLLAGPVDVREALEDALEGHGKLQLGDALAEALVYAVAEGNVLVGILAQDVEAVRIRKDARVRDSDGSKTSHGDRDTYGQ